MTKTKVFLVFAFLSLALSVTIVVRSLNLSRPTVQAVSVQTPVKTFTAADIKKYDGTDPSLPIYIALNGLVYDVTAGKDFYQTGGSYHYLAGRDSSTELNMVGGGIIKSKYPVVGQYQP